MPDENNSNNEVNYVLKAAGNERPRYVDYLIQRLTDFRRAGVKFGQKHGGITFGVTLKIVRSQLGCDPHDVSRFDDVCAYLKGKIDATILGKRNHSRGVRNYHELGEHGQKICAGSARGGVENAAPENVAHCSATGPERDVETRRGGSGPVLAPFISRQEAPQGESVDVSPNRRESEVNKYSDQVDDLRGVEGLSGKTIPAVTFKEWQLKEAHRRLSLLQAFFKLVGEGLSRTKAAKEIGVDYTSVWRWTKLVVDCTTPEEQLAQLIPQTDECGRKPEFMPTTDELACVRSIYIKLNDSKVRGRGLGSSKVTAFRLAAKSEDPRIGDIFRQVVLKRNSKSIPPSWARLLDVPAAVLEYSRDKSSFSRSHNTTPRGMTYINAHKEEVPLRAGSIFESDDGTVNFPIWIPWPYGGDKCSDKFGVKMGRFQLLPVVDRRTRCCVAFHMVIRAKSSYRGEDVVAIFGDCFSDIGLPEAMCLERNTWECLLAKVAMDTAGVPVVRAWEPKQKGAVENFFDRLWTPLSLLPGDVGRKRGEHVDNTDKLMQCEAGRLDPRSVFLGVDAAVKGIGNGVSFVNSEPVESGNGWGRWIPHQMFMDQTENCATLHKLPAQMRIFFCREQREWTVRANVVGGEVPTPMLNMPVYFQSEELWEFEGCRVKCFFDPFSDCVTATIVLMENEWRSYKRGHIVAQNVPILERPPQAVLAADYTRSDELERGLAIRKAMAKAVRTEYWNFMGGRRSEARDGLGNHLAVGPAQDRTQLLTSVTAAAVQKLRNGPIQPRISLSAPSPEEFKRRSDRMAKEAAASRNLTEEFSIKP